MVFAQALESMLAAYHQQDAFSGAVLIQKGGHTLFANAYGYAERRWHVANTLNTRFRIASIGKMFTAVAILQLVEQGTLTLETTLAKVLAPLPNTIPTGVTIHQLLTMTAGIPDWFDEENDDWDTLRTTQPLYLLRRNRDYLPLLINKTSASPLGDYHYNNASYTLLGLVIETVSGQDYADYIREHIFAKAKMAHADFIAIDDTNPNVATGYIQHSDDAGKTTWHSNIYQVTAEGAADGGSSATVTDLCRFNQALRGGALLRQLTHTALIPHVVDSDMRPKGYLWMYGYGQMFIMQDEHTIIRQGHTGEEDGVSGRLYYYPQHDLDVAILANQGGCTGDIGWDIDTLIEQMLA